VPLDTTELLLGEGNEVVLVGTEMLNFAHTEANSDSKAGNYSLDYVIYFEFMPHIGP
jgi:hypothetical protein